MYDVSILLICLFCFLVGLFCGPRQEMYDVSIGFKLVLVLGYIGYWYRTQTEYLNPIP